MLSDNTEKDSTAPRQVYHTQVPPQRMASGGEEGQDVAVAVPSFREAEREETEGNSSFAPNGSLTSPPGSVRSSDLARSRQHTFTLHRGTRGEVSARPADDTSPFLVTVKVTRDGKEVEEKLDPHELAKLYASKQAALDSLTQKFDYFGVPEWVQLHPTLGCYLAEFTGTFAWVLTFSLTSVRNDSVFSLNTDMTCVTIGFMFTAIVFTLAYVSGGHFNPAISVAVFMTRNMELITMLGYIIAQICAAVAAGFVAMLLQSSGSDIYVPYIEEDYVSKGIFSELIFTLAIVLVVLNIGYSRQKGNFFYGFAIGMCVTAGSACVGHVSGGSFNPAASTGLQLAQCITGDCEAIKSFWVYWLAPLIGSVIASLLYAQMYQPEDTQVLQDFMVFKDKSNNTMGDNDTRRPAAPAAAVEGFGNTSPQGEQQEWYDSSATPSDHDGHPSREGDEEEMRSNPGDGFENMSNNNSIDVNDTPSGKHYF